MTAKERTGEAEKKLDPRLACAAGFVRQGAVFADIGTDHAYLPIALLGAGTIAYAIAADIAEKPLVSARAHLDACAKSNPALYDKMDIVQTDGLSGLENHIPRVTDIAVCGMGGELIARILDGAPFVKNPDIRLILQPMTMQPFLRRYLAQTGFSVDCERLCRTANGKLYSVMCCHYTGERRTLSDSDAILGAALLADIKNRPYLTEYLKTKAETLDRIVSGKSGAGQRCEAEASALAKARRLLGSSAGAGADAGADAGESANHD